jgi:hypothetical protein
VRKSVPVFRIERGATPELEHRIGWIPKVDSTLGPRL